MAGAIDPVKKQVIHGVSRDRIAVDNGIGAGTASNIIDEWKKGVQDSDYESVREFAIHCKEEDISLGNLTSALRIKDYIKYKTRAKNEWDNLLPDGQSDKTHKSLMPKRRYGISMYCLKN